MKNSKFNLILATLTSMVLVSSCDKVKEKLKNDWKDYIFMNEIPYREVIVKGLDDELNKNKYIVDMTAETELRKNIEELSLELIQRGRL